MTKENLIWLTKEVYRLTLLFPKKEPLRYKMRELADDILADSLRITNQYEYTNRNNPSTKKTETGSLQVLKDLEVLDSFFEVAKDQNWVRPAELLAIQREYANLRGELEKPSAIEKTKEKVEVLPRQSVQVRQEMPSQAPQVLNQLASQTLAKNGLNQRQEMILEFLREQGNAQVWQIKQILPDISKRTLRRDFERMLGQGVIERVGEKNDTFYQIKALQL